MSFRPGSRIFSAFRRTNFAQFYARRNASTAGAEPAGFAKFWNSPVGPKTVHFWYVSSMPHSTSSAIAFQTNHMPYLRPHPKLSNNHHKLPTQKLTMFPGPPS
jgi:hypothetical protein